MSVSRSGRFMRLVACVLLAGSVVSGAAWAAADEAPLIAAVKAEDAGAVSALLDGGADVNATQPDGATALHWAAFRDHHEIASRLIAAGADVNAANELGATALWLAADNGSATMVERLLAAGARADRALSEGETPVMTASRTGNADAVTLLVAAGADVNVAEDTRGQTALMWAVAQGHHAVVAALIEHGADVAARSRLRSRLMHADATNASQYDQGVHVAPGRLHPAALRGAARRHRVGAAAAGGRRRRGRPRSDRRDSARAGRTQRPWRVRRRSA